MSVYMRMRGAAGTIRLDQQSRTGYGMEVHVGVTGLGLPPVTAQYRTGAGDGAQFRGRRTQPRDIDLPISLYYPSRSLLKEGMSRLALMLAQPFDLDLVEDTGEYWTLNVVRVGGGDYAYGEGTIGERELRTVVTVRAGDPYFVSGTLVEARVDNAGAGRGLLKGLTKMQVSASQAIGMMTLANVGEVETWPTWIARGPGKNLNIRLPDGSGFTWEGEIGAGQDLAIYTRESRVTLWDGPEGSGSSTSAYADLAPAPYFFPLPPGTTVATVSMTDTTAESFIRASWRPRKWWVV
jgi:hypothetical protein